MAAGKWGESFLKSGLPLEHMAMSILTRMGWDCETNYEYERLNRDGKQEWFELDLEAESPFIDANQPSLKLIVECKYHDPSRFWMLLPHVPTRWHFEDRLLNYAPFEALGSRRHSSLLKLAPTSVRGVVVSQDGQKQDDALYTAIQQVFHGFLPIVLDHGFGYSLDVKRGYSPPITAYIPMIITNADLFRMLPSVSSLSDIRKANDPSDIAERLQWTWLYYDIPIALLDQQRDFVVAHQEVMERLMQKYPAASKRLTSMPGRPNWIALVNIEYLESAVEAIFRQFTKIKARKPEEFL